MMVWHKKEGERARIGLNYTINDATILQLLLFFPIWITGHCQYYDDNGNLVISRRAKYIKLRFRINRQYHIFWQVSIGTSYIGRVRILKTREQLEDGIEGELKETPLIDIGHIIELQEKALGPLERQLRRMHG